MCIDRWNCALYGHYSTIQVSGKLNAGEKILSKIDRFCNYQTGRSRIDVSLLIVLIQSLSGALSRSRRSPFGEGAEFFPLSDTKEESILPALIKAAPRKETNARHTSRI